MRRPSTCYERGTTTAFCLRRRCLYSVSLVTLEIFGISTREFRQVLQRTENHGEPRKHPAGPAKLTLKMRPQIQGNPDRARHCTTERQQVATTLVSFIFCTANKTRTRAIWQAPAPTKLTAGVLPRNPRRLRRHLPLTSRSTPHLMPSTAQAQIVVVKRGWHGARHRRASPSMQGLWQPVQEHARVAFNCDYLMEHVPEDRLHFHVAAGMWHEPRQTLETLQWVLSVSMRDAFLSA